MSQEASQYLHDAETAEDFRYRKGFWDGHQRTVQFVEVLISMAEEKDSDVLERELGRLIDPFRQVRLSKQGDEEEETEERSSRVLERARNVV